MSTFLEVVELLLSDDDAKSTYAENPDGFLDQHGLGGLDSADVADAMLYASDSLPLPVAARLDADAGLESVAQLDLEANGLTLEREPIALDDIAPDDVEPDVGADVDFDTDPGGATEAANDVVETVLDTDASGELLTEQADLDDAVASSDAAVIEVPTSDEGADVNSTDIGDALTDFVPVAEAVIETEDERLDDGTDEFDPLDFADVDPTDLDFLD